MAGEKMRKFAFILQIILAVILFSSSIFALTTTFQMNSTYGQDTYIQETAKTTNSGTLTYFQADSESGKSERTLLYFDLYSLPSSSIIGNATLSLYLSSGTGSNFNLSVYRLTANWTETGVNWNTKNGTASWATLGGDYSLTNYSLFFVNNTVGWKSWDVKQLIQELANNTYTNFGFILIPQVQAGNNYKQFASRESGANTPKLTIDYVYDTTSPSINNFAENPANNSAYSSSTYNFTANITDNTALASVWIDFNGVNYTSTTNSSSIFSFSISNLASGTYYYRWHANDTLGNLNSSSLRYFTVSKAEPSLTLLSSSGWNYNYGTESTFTCNSNYGTPKLYISNSEVSNPTSIILGANSYNIKCNLTESQNYSAGIAQGSLTVNKINSQTSLSFDKTSPQNYGTSITPTCSLLSGVGNPVLKLNNDIINSGEQLNLGAATYNFNCSLSESQNYTSSSSYQQFIIEQASTATTLTLSPGSPIIYPTASNFSCYNSQGLSVILYINGLDKTEENSLDIIRQAGNYTVNCTSTSNENYSSSSSQQQYTITSMSGDIKLYLNSQEDNLTIEYPEQYNITATTLYGAVAIYKDGLDISSDNGKNITPAKTQAYYNITAVSSGDENHSSSSITKWLNVTLDSLPPDLSIISPQEGGTYGYNTSISLEYSVSDLHLDSCWYNLNSGANITLASCQNITFNASSDGQYLLSLYANDSLGNTASTNSTFSVLVGSPTITLNSPIGIYLNSNNVIFRYIPEDLDLQSCELWGDFTGSWQLNQTSNPINNAENTFSLTLPDGVYKWNIRCNDSQAHSSFNGNKTFYVDTIPPLILINNPSGTKSARTNIPITSSISDASPTTCKYNIKWSTGLEVIPNTTLSDCSSSSFNVSADGDYIFSLYASDFAGNANSSSSGFTVSTSSSPPVSSPGSSGGSFTSNIASGIDFTLSNLIVDPGETKKISVSIKNSGSRFLNNCQLKGKGNYSSWISSSELKGLSIGEVSEFIFTLSIPKVSPGRYNLELALGCNEAGISKNFIAEILKKEILVSIIKSSRIQDEFEVVYSLSELSGIEQNSEVTITLLNQNEKIAEKTELIILGAGSSKEFTASLKIPQDLTGNFNLLVSVKSQDFLAFAQENVLLGKSQISGFSILGSTTLESFLNLFLIIAFLVFAVFIIRRIFRLKKMSGMEKRNYSPHLHEALRKLSHGGVRDVK